MTYREEMGRLAEALRQLIADGGTVPGADLAAAMAGHASLVAAITEIHADLAHSAHQPKARNLADVERHPVGVLGQLLKAQPSITDQAFTDVLQSPAASTAGKLWREVAKSATLAQYEWQRTAPDTRPTGDAAWSEIADLAYLSEAVAVLDEDLADSLTATDRVREAIRFRHAARSGLRLAAQEAQHLAARGHLPANEEIAAAPSTKLLVKVSPADLPEALARLDRMIATSANLPPPSIAAVGRAIAESAVSAAASMDLTGNRASAAVLREHAALLAQASGRIRGVVALEPGTVHASAQAQVIKDVLTHEHRKGIHLPLDIADAIARAIPQLTRDLAANVERQLTTGRWLVPMEGTTALRWVKGTISSEPPVLHALLRASDHAQRVNRFLAPADAQTSAPSPRRLLSPALNSRSPARPITPSTPSQAAHRRR